MPTLPPASAYALVLQLLRTEFEKHEQSRRNAQQQVTDIRRDLAQAEDQLAVHEATCAELSAAITMLSPPPPKATPEPDFTKPATGGALPTLPTTNVIKPQTAPVKAQPVKTVPAKAIPSMIAICACAHTKRRHDEFGCEAGGCDCTAFTAAS